MLTGISSELPDGYVLEALKNTQTENELARGQLFIAQRTLLNQQRKIAELESRTVQLPKPKDSDPGWKIDPEFISKVQNEIGYDDQCECWEGTPSMEVVEAVLLAAAGIKVNFEGEQNTQPLSEAERAGPQERRKAERDTEPYGFTEGDRRGMIYKPEHADRLSEPVPVYRHAQPASVAPDALIKAVDFYKQVKRENPPVETGSYKDAVEWVLKEACRAVIKDE
ncbi:hypothetical protein [Klebsiella pneumoniae]|nr:hypothetical protein [Klebsiella pneumoniae]MDE8914927.1 hypothetical protein [Klebsiella pneumoniae]